MIRLPQYYAAFVTLELTWATSNVSWFSPMAGDAFEPGQPITGRWLTDDVVVSPAFCLCDSEQGATSDDSCGETVWPAVQQTDDTYQIMLYDCIESLATACTHSDRTS
ncbi:hypothetical protein K474DRAFT_1660316 [Panus rudis PR-1116 ss-1]|nr:hypothetical protein K474DRAFT_1660316 [Panus rudis PR-1116 ss-1]